MIPKRLKIKGLYSYQTEQEIDFDPLTDASLFGIFGAVGSGKSSVLEAITFALYGDTERLNKMGDDRTYNMMNLRSDELLIDFECIAGKKGDHYRFTVKGKRNSKNFKDVKTFERKAYILQEENWVPLSENESTESIIGLSYDNFRRTIIIPQGRFQEFIELKDSERTRMMKELFQLEKYDLSRNVGSLARQNDIAISNLDGQLLGLAEVTPEMVQAEETRREAVRAEIKRIGDELLVQTELEAGFQKLKQVADKLNILREKLAVLETQRASMQERERLLQTFEICSLHFRSAFDQKTGIVTAMARNRQLSTGNQARIAELTALLQKQQETLVLLKPRYEKREELLDAAGELEKVIQVIDHTQAAAKRKEALGRGEEQLREKERTIELLKNQKSEQETENEKRKSKLTDVQELGLVKSWFTMLDGFNETRIAIKNEAETLQQEIGKQQQELITRQGEIASNFSISFPEVPALELFQNKISEYLETNESSRKSLTGELVKIRTKIALHEYAGSLDDGEPCPLCGSLHHPDVLTSDQSLSQDILLVEKQIVTLAEQERAIRKLQLTVERIFSQIENLEKQKISIKQRYGDVQARLKAHDEAFVWDKFNKADREGFEKHFAETNGVQSQIRASEAAIKSLGEQVEAALHEKIEKIEKPLQILRDEILRFENTVQTLSGQLLKVRLEDFEGQEKADILQKVAGFKSDYEEITRLFAESEKLVDALEKERNTLTGSEAAIQAALEESVRDLAGIQSEIERKLSEHGFESEAQVAEILGKPVQIESERKAINEYKFALETTDRDLRNLLEEHPEQQYDAKRHDEVIQAKELLTAQLNMQRKEEGSIDGRLKKMADDLAKKALLLKEKERLYLRKAHLDDLGKLFRSSGFVDYASSIYLQNLIQAANHRFHQMTHQQLHLELGEGNSFWVRDLLNGGHLRLLKTLSGGQKFQAALSLALALADHIHIRNESKHNFFFLDEGFGSLDRNALQTVFDTLKSLRKENRIVGIISHVEDLQQEIQTYLRIIESEEGSRIVPSWK